jgi:RHS repeat-associated protein
MTGGGTFYYHYDNLGSVANVTSASGASQWTQAYEPFGAVRTETQDDASAPENPMKFAGEHADPTGLYYLRARQYDPSIGRFTRLDPASAPLREPYVSAYAYAANRPTALVDPSGETAEPVTEGQFFAAETTSPETPRTIPTEGGKGLQRVAYAYYFFIDYGLRRFRSAALVGNFWAETEQDPLNPRIHENEGGPGRGIAQWTFSTRWQDLIRFARQRRISEWNLTTQLRFVWYELHTSERFAWDQLQSKTNVTAAAISVQNDYERADPGRQHRRIHFSRLVLAEY